MLPDSFQPEKTKRKNGLSLAGLGAGLAITSLSQDASAAVQGSTDTQSIAASGTSASGQKLTIPIDIDGDGNTEFNLVGWIASNTSEVLVDVEAVEAGARVVGSGYYADQVAGNASIDAGSAYTTLPAHLAWSETKGDSGDWLPVVQRGYAGVAFDFEGNTHYGSLDIEVSKFNAVYNSDSSEVEATLYGYVWETTPGAAIQADAAPDLPAPSSVPVGSFAVSATLFVVLCLLGLRRLYQQPA